MKKSSPWKVGLGVLAALNLVAAVVFYFMDGKQLIDPVETPASSVADSSVAAQEVDSQNALNEQARQELEDQMRQMLLDAKITLDEYNADMAKLQAEKQDEAEQASKAKSDQELLQQDLIQQQAQAMQQAQLAPQVITVNAPPDASLQQIQPVDQTQNALQPPYNQEDLTQSPAQLTPTANRPGQGPPGGQLYGLIYLPGPPKAYALVSTALSQREKNDAALRSLFSNVKSMQLMPVAVIYTMNSTAILNARVLDDARGNMGINAESGRGEVNGFTFAYIIKDDSGNPIATVKLIADTGPVISGYIATAPATAISRQAVQSGYARTVTEITTDGYDQSVANAIDQLSNNSEVNAGQYEIRLLYTLNDKLRVIWLKALVGRKDFFIPLWIKPGLCRMRLRQASSIFPATFCRLSNPSPGDFNST